MGELFGEASPNNGAPGIIWVTSIDKYTLPVKCDYFVTET